MFRNFSENVFVPNPILKHLAGHFHEIFFNGCTCKCGIVSLATHIVHNMAKLMEKGDNIAMRQQRRLAFLCVWRTKIGDHRSCSRYNFAINNCPTNKWKRSRMIVLIRPWIKIKVKMSKQLFCFWIFNLINSYIFMPSCSFRQLNKFKAQQLLIYLHSCQLYIFRWEIFTYKVFINSMFFFLL